jgi:putative peptidoglycan lipid II flippase
MSDQAKVIQSSAAMAAGTLVSRITGFIRNIIIVATLGTALLGDAYNVGNTMPNVLYNLLIGGALTAVFLPQIVRAAQDSDGGEAFISRLVTLILSILILLTFMAMAMAGLLLKLYAPTFTGREAEITLIFIWFCLPQIIFYGLFALLGQIANAKGVFAPMAWAPIVNNLVVIGVFLSFLILYPDLTTSTISDTQVKALALGTTLGIIAQSFALIPTLRRLRVKLRPDFHWRGVGLRKSINLAGWTLVYALITQLGFLITVNLGTRISKEASDLGLLGGFGFTPYQNAYLIFLLPHSIFTISIATATLPQLSRLVQLEKIEDIRSQLIQSLRLVGVVIIPSAFFLFFFGESIGRAIFFGVSRDDAEFIGRILTVFAFALIPLSLNLIFIRALNAFENTKYQSISNFGINTIATFFSFLAYIFLPVEFKMIGIAGAFSISYIFGVFITFYCLKTYLLHLSHRNYLRLYIKLSLLSLFFFGIFAAFQGFIPSDGPWASFYLFAALLLSLSGYLISAKKSGVDEISKILTLFRAGRVGE